MPITSDTTLTIGLVLTLMGAAASFGIMWDKITNAEKKRDEDEGNRKEYANKVDERMTRLETKIDAILEILADDGLKKT
jgi:hypothetical protein